MRTRSNLSSNADEIFFVLQEVARPLSAYAITFLSPVGVSTETEASAADVAALIDQIKAEGVKAYFFESSNDPRLVQQIAGATGAGPGGELFVESLSDASGPAATYADMFRHNVDLIAAALAK